MGRRQALDFYKQNSGRVVSARAALDDLQMRSVLMGRVLGLSWDDLGRDLDVPGETLRRRYAARVRLVLDHVEETRTGSSSAPRATS